MKDVEQRPPVIITRWEFLPDKPNGDIDLDLCFLHGGELEFDHIDPIFAGGSFELNNIQALCKSCHNKKSNMDYRYNNSKKYSFSKYLNEWGMTI